MQMYLIIIDKTDIHCMSADFMANNRFQEENKFEDT